MKHPHFFLSLPSSYSVKPLQNMKEYMFRVRAVNAVGESEPLATQRSTIAKNQFGETPA